MQVAERYTLGAPLGRGGMGEVYRGRDELLGREVAVKFLLPTRQGDLAAARFHREARAAATLNDPHVVAAFDFGDHEDGHFLVMELVEGRSVADELRERGPLPAGQALGIIRQAAAGLAAAHRQDIVHRDIKPANLLLGTDGLVKVADFGIARFIADTTTTLTATGQVVGTSHYMAPERAIGGPAGPASDVYALGCVLYQLLTGHPPFQADQPASIMYQHVQLDAVPPSDLRPELAGDCETLLFRMLAKDPADRPTAAEIASGAVLAALPNTPADGRANGPDAPTVPLAFRLRSRRGALAVGAAVAATAASVALAVLTGPDLGKLPTTDLQPASTPTTTTPSPAAVRTTPPPKSVATTSRPATASTSKSSTRQPTAPGKHGKGQHSKTPKDKPTKKS